MDAPRKVIGIVGAAIAGPVLALQILSHPILKRRFRPILFEQLGQVPQNQGHIPVQGGSILHTAGAGVGIFPNGLYPLFELGLREELETISCEMADLEVFRGDLSGHHKPCNRLKNAGWDADLATCPRIFERQRLRDLFLQWIVKLGGEVSWDKKVRSFAFDTGRRPRADFEDGESATVDILVGADGAWSPTRKFILEQRDSASASQRWPATFTSVAGIYGISSSPTITRALQHVGGNKASLVLLDRGNIGALPLEDGKLAWTLQLPEPTKPPDTRQSSSERPTSSDILETKMVQGIYDPSYTAKILRDHEAVYHPELGHYKSIFESSERIIHGPLRQQVWNENEIYYENVVLIGDAARVMPPYTGQGSSLGVEDATCLADCLLNNGKNTQAALQEYARRRVPRSKKVDQLGWWSGKISTGERWWWRWIRDVTFGIPVKDPKISKPSYLDSSQDWLFKERVQVKLRHDNGNIQSDGSQMRDSTESQAL